MSPTEVRYYRTVMRQPSTEVRFPREPLSEAGGLLHDPLDQRVAQTLATRRMKKFINDPEQVVGDWLAGLGSARPDLVRVDLENQLVIRADAPVRGKVAVVSGGGAGHEPLHGGFVGHGMLDAASIGAIFTSPGPDRILRATKAVNGDVGIVYVVKNYTGDVMNFKLAAELADEAGIAVECVLTNDDVAVEDSLFTAGRRGTGITLLVEKIAGASAEAGAPLADVVAVARRANARGRSFGVALTSCVTPAAGKPTFELGPDEIEFGVGIHGEPGRERRMMASAAEIVGEMIETILADLRPRRSSRLLAFVNGLGATPLLELYIVYHELAENLARRGLKVERSLVGNYVTSLDMAGISITLLELDEELTALWDAPVSTPGLRWGM